MNSREKISNTHLLVMQQNKELSKIRTDRPFLSG